MNYLKEKLKESQVKSKNLKITNEDDIIEEIISSDFVLCTVDKPQRIIRRLINKICVEEGLRFAIREGGRTVASGVVASIVE